MPRPNAVNPSNDDQESSISGYVYLAIAVCAEVGAPFDEGAGRLPPPAVTLADHLWLQLVILDARPGGKTIPVGIAYAAWVGLGIVLVSGAAALIYRQNLDLPALRGMALIIAGTEVIQLVSGSTGHRAPRELHAVILRVRFPV